MVACWLVIVVLLFGYLWFMLFVVYRLFVRYSVFDSVWVLLAACLNVYCLV